MKKLALVSTLFLSHCFAGENLELLISAEEIAQRVQEIASQIDANYVGEQVTLISIFKGSICITADLMRAMRTPLTLEAIKASSYGKNGSTRGSLKITGIENLDLQGQHLLIVDDIFDSGYTMTNVVEQLKMQNPKSLKTLVLLMKNISRELSYRPDYVLFEIEDRFVVGYGLDYKELYRGLPGIYALD